MSIVNLTEFEYIVLGRLGRSRCRTTPCPSNSHVQAQPHGPTAYRLQDGYGSMFILPFTQSARPR